MSLKKKNKRNFITSVKDCINGLNFIMLNENNFKRESKKEKWGKRRRKEERERKKWNRE